MGINHQSRQGTGHFEPIVTRTFLPRCESCHAPHPLARKGYDGDPSICPDCKHSASPPGKTYFQRGQLTGGVMVAIAGALLAFGEWLGGLAERIGR